MPIALSYIKKPRANETISLRQKQWTLEYVSTQTYDTSTNVLGCQPKRSDAELNGCFGFVCNQSSGNPLSIEGLLHSDFTY